MESGWEIGFELDRRWHWLRGEMETSKKPTLLELARILSAAGTEYALIGGLALQLHQDQPRTTLDIDLALLSCSALPRQALVGAGFTHGGDFLHSQNWRGPDGTPVQFTDDPAFEAGIRRAEARQLEGASLRVLRVEDLLRSKLRAAVDPARRRSKRLQDLGDAQALIELHSELSATLTPEQLALLSVPLR